MASTGRRYSVDLARRLRETPQQFRFFQAVRLLSLIRARTLTQGVREGGIRFRTPANLAFPASEVLALRDGASRDDESAKDEQARMEMVVGFFGLTGPSGVLPSHYTEFLQERQNQKDMAAHAFFDLFTHRALCLFYEAWKKNRLHLAEEQEGRHLSRYLLSFVGIDPNLSEKNQDAFPLEFLAFFSGSLSQRPMAAGTLPAIANSFFNVSVRLEQFVGQWLNVPAEERSRMGLGGCSLGRDLFPGARVWEQQTRVRLRMGPMKHAQFSTLLPGGHGAQVLARLAQTCLGQVLGCDVCLILDKDEIPKATLGKSRLGLDCWLHTRAVERDLDDLVYCVQA